MENPNVVETGVWKSVWPEVVPVNLSLSNAISLSNKKILEMKILFVFIGLLMWINCFSILLYQYGFKNVCLWYIAPSPFERMNEDLYLKRSEREIVKCYIFLAVSCMYFMYWPFCICYINIIFSHRISCLCCWMPCLKVWPNNLMAFPARIQ